MVQTLSNKIQYEMPNDWHTRLGVTFQRQLNGENQVFECVYCKIVYTL